MLAATYTQGGGLSVQTVPVPQIRNDELLLRVTAASICGTDLRIIRSGHRKLQDGQRIVLGHEFLGVIEQVGTLVEGYSAGQRVGLVPNAGCGHCDACSRARDNYCAEYTAFGIDRDGGQAPLVSIPGRFVNRGNVIPLPDTVSDREAALLEPFSCVVNGVRASRIRLGDTVLIYGAGPIGLMHLMLCRIAGAAKIIVVDPLPHRLERARELAADLVLTPQSDVVPDRVRHETNGCGADVVITACPVPEVQTEALQVLAPFGRLCLFGGLPKAAATVNLDTNAIHYGSLIVTGSTGGSIEDYRIALKLVAGRRVDLTRVISHVFPLTDLKHAYETALAGGEGKIVLLAAPS
jgi:threonine dehydrogenase-like Zn-dependent dehydrogenase